ncbi:MAG: SatD family protein [Maribacter sp.]|nr:SatD family protein [Maribacter sp.]
MKTIAIITGDIINSRGHNTAVWMDSLKSFLLQFGDTPSTWEIYRGDEIQIRMPMKQALYAALQLKALIKSIKGLDIRMAIGIGSETYIGAGISESNGTAYQRSGRTLEALKENKVTLMFASADEKYNKTINLMLKLASDFMDDWSPVSAEIVFLSLISPNVSQQNLAEQLNIKQSAVSQRMKRARLNLVEDLLMYYEETIKAIKE